MASEQDDKGRVKFMMCRAISTSVYIMAPLMTGVAFCAEFIVEIVLTDKWLPCVPFLRIFCIMYMFYPIHTANINAIKAMGRSDLFLKLGIEKRCVGMSLLLLTMMAMAYSLLVSTLTSMIIILWSNKTLIGYSFKEQMINIFSGIFFALFMGVAISSVRSLTLSDFATLVLQISLGDTFISGCHLSLKLGLLSICGT